MTKSRRGNYDKQSNNNFNENNSNKTITLSSNHIFRTGIQERGDEDIQDDERNVDGGLLELQQTHR